ALHRATVSLRLTWRGSRTLRSVIDALGEPPAVTSRVAPRARRMVEWDPSTVIGPPIRTDRHRFGASRASETETLAHAHGTASPRAPTGSRRSRPTGASPPESIRGGGTGRGRPRSTWRPSPAGPENRPRRRRPGRDNRGSTP